jgi:acyl-CoA thioester hydrolase
MQKHITNIQHRFNDFDILGHVNNAVYQHYFDVAKLAYFNSVLKEEAIGNNYTLVLAHVSIDYMVPIEHNNQTQISSQVSEIGNKSLTMVQEILNKNTSNRHAACKSVLVCYDIKKKETCPIPQVWKDSIKTFEKNVVIKMS